MKTIWNNFKVAFAMYSKIPMPPADWEKENMKYALCFFPWVGLSPLNCYSFFLPLIINKALTAFFEQDTACIIMMIIGLLLIATHNIWIKNIYNRFMKRRYENMEGFRDSR